MKKSIPPIVYFFRFYFNTIGLLIPKRSARLLRKLFSTPRKRVVRESELEILNAAKKDFVIFEENKMKIYEWGIGEKLAVLFHGWESNAGSLGAFVKPLMQLGYKVVAFDAPAHGGSGGKRANLVYFKRAAKFILEKYPHPDLVVGHSLGANSIIMTSYEEKLKFEKVILVAPLNRLMSVFEDMKELLKIPESLFKRFIDNFEKWAGYSFRDFYFHDYGDKSKIENVLIFHDRNDRITKYSHAEAFEENWKEVELYTINNTGHYKILWDSEMIKKSIDYIAS